MATSVATESSLEGESRTPIPLRRKVAYAGIAVLLMLLLAEGAARLLWAPKGRPVGSRRFVEWLSDLSPADDRSESLYAMDPERIWVLRSGVDITSVNPHHHPNGDRQRIHITVNDRGYRGPSADESLPDDALRILCLGDSNVFGYPLDDQHVLPAVLERTLQDQLGSERAVEVLNAGTPGYTVVQGRLWHEREFADYPYDWLVLSFLNNDAWPQPYSDREVIDREARVGTSLARPLRNLRLFGLMHSFVGDPVESEFVPRVPIDEYVAEYRALLQSATGRGARVLVLDYRAYPQYEPYSVALKALCAESNAEYISVTHEIAGIEGDGPVLDEPDLAKRVRRRWGDQLLTARPYLWMYAEYHPEHLNEVGVAWISRRVAGVVGTAEP